MKFLMAAIILLLGVSAVQSGPVVVDEIPVAPVWPGHPVGFCLMTRGDRQYVAFYNAKRQMTVGMRKLNMRSWQFVKLDETLGWDSHNYVTFAFDRDGYIHLSGNMHGHPLVYFRSEKPEDIQTLVRHKAMTGKLEGHVTYPHFFTNSRGELIFTYRDGSSGKGDQIYNIYDADKQQWKRLLDTPLTDGQGLMNAYFNGPRKGPDGRFHLVWMWRDTGDCITNHDLNYARSEDLLNWQSAGGQTVQLPLTVEEKLTSVDPVPSAGGLLNISQFVGFDHADNAVVTYHKHDSRGNTQAYAARWENNAWNKVQITDWDYRWDFKGGGSIPVEITLGPVSPAADGTLEMPYWHTKYGKGIIVLDNLTLKPTGTKPAREEIPSDALVLEDKSTGMAVRTQWDSGISGESEIRYLLKWETLPVNRDQPHKGDIPAASMLKVYKVKG